MTIDEKFGQEILQRKKAGLNRELRQPEKGIDFCSNDYLGLARSQSFSNAIETEVSKSAWAAGSSGSRLISGNHEYIEHLEQDIAQFHRADAAMLFPNGYMANVGLYSCLASREDTYILDEYVHASIIDGCRLSFAKRKKFKHNNLEDLEKLLATSSGKKWVIVESVYSMLGDESPLEEILNVMKDYDAELIVDEAHSVGLYGENGRGRVAENQLENDVFARVVTYGKAFGVSGAAVLGSNNLKSFLINHSRPFIYSTAPTPAFYISIKIAYDFVKNMEGERQQLKDLKVYLNQKLLDHTSHVETGGSAISFIPVVGNEAVMSFQQKLNDLGIQIVAMRSPTVPEGNEGLRLCLHSYNTKDEIDFLSQQIQHT